MQREIALSTEIMSHTEYIWDIITRVRQQTASQSDIDKAHQLSDRLCDLLEEYDEGGYSYLLPTTLWLAREVCSAVDVVSDLALNNNFYA